MKLTIADRLPSPANKKAAERGSVKVALVQFSWNEDEAAHRENIASAVALAAQNGAEIVFLPELTLSRYPADTLPTGTPSDSAEELESGPTFTLLAELAKAHSVFVHGSLYEKTGFTDGRGLNTAIVVNESIPITEYPKRYGIK